MALGKIIGKTCHVNGEEGDKVSVASVADNKVLYDFLIALSLS